MKKKFSILLLVIILSHESKSQHIYTIGPTLHWNIGNKSCKPSWGLEFSCYSKIFDLPEGYDIAIEHQKTKTRIYSEYQRSFIFMGYSIGPYIELSKEQPMKLGLQGSVWANAFIGLDLRYRVTRGEHYFAPGLYAKAMWYSNGSLSDYTHKYNAVNSNDTDSYHHHHHFHH